MTERWENDDLTESELFWAEQRRKEKERERYKILELHRLEPPEPIGPVLARALGGFPKIKRRG